MSITNRSGSERNPTFYLRYGNDQDWPDQWQYCLDGTCGSCAFWGGFQAQGLSGKAAYKFRPRSSGSTCAGYMVIRSDFGNLLTGFMINCLYVYKNEGEIVDSTGVTPSRVSTRFLFPAEYRSGGLVKKPNPGRRPWKSSRSSPCWSVSD